MGTKSIIILVAIALSAVLLVIQIIMAFKKHSSISPIPFILLVLGISFVILTPYKGQELETKDQAQIVLMMGLVMITAVYAWSTEKMAREMRAQRYSENLPLLVPTIPRDWHPLPDPNEIPCVYLQSGIGIKVMWCNVGKGVAINSRFSFWTALISPGTAKFFPPRESGTLEVGGEKEVNYHEASDGQLRDISDAYRPHLLAEYQDIYEREITTVQEFRIEGQNDNKRAFIGDLYFTVNGKRLGKEKESHD